MKTSKSSMSLSSSWASESSKKSQMDSLTNEKSKKVKKPGVIAQITRRTRTSHDPKKEPEPVLKKKTPLTGIKEVEPPSKMATLPRMFKPKSSRSPVSGKSTLPKSPSVSFHEAPSPPIKHHTSASKTTSLSFNELKKQHQYLLKEVEELRTNMMQMDQRHATEMESMREELSKADQTIGSLKEDLRSREAEVTEKDKVITNLQANSQKLESEKDRLLMVIECAQRDALTGEKIVPDIASWQTMMDEAHSQTEHFSKLIESMTNELISTGDQLKEQTHEIEAGMKSYTESRVFLV